MHHLAAFVLCAALATGCAHPPTPTPDPWHDPALAAAMEGSETGAAVGLLSAPASRSVITWLGQLLLQAVTNTTVQLRITSGSAGSEPN